MRDFADENNIEWEKVLDEMDSSSMNKKNQAKALVNYCLKNPEFFIAYLNRLSIQNRNWVIPEVNEDLAKNHLMVTDIEHNCKLVSIPSNKEIVNQPEEKSGDDMKKESSFSIKSGETKSTAINEPDPQLESKYFQILKIINESGKSMEKQSSVYSDDENKLRDQLVTVLTTHLSGGSVTAESINRKGKTDILIREGGSNLFIAECKIWRGKADFLSGISQLLSDSTWRDLYTAIIIFFKAKKISDVLQTVQKEISSHENYEKKVDKSDRSWFNYEFHYPGDKKIKIKLAVLIFKLS
ncbi:MAG: hypothetical protein HY295_00200 [Thaumarchaeota archaeon]|nr:hypothetical protein [Nitrososphaerota archaeon]